MKIENLKKIIQNKKIILIDCFNTILWRRIEEVEVEKLYFDGIEEKLKLDRETLYEFWTIVKKTNLCNDGREEREFKELVEDLYLRLIYNNNLNITQTEFYKLCVEEVINVEKKVCELNVEIIGLLIEMKKQGKIIVCVSDFFLPKKQLEELFVFLGIEKIFDNIIISSEIGKRKSKGKIYEYLKEKYSLTKDNSVMIGDNKISDYIMANKNGIEGVLYKKIFPTKKVQNILIKYLEVYNLKNKNEINYFKNYSFIFYVFFERLYKKVKMEKINKVFFFSREG